MSHKVFGIGEILWDLLPSGLQMGGAPTNFTCHAHALGADAGIISRVGEDDLGREICVRLQALGVSVSGVGTDATHSTGTVSVELDGAGQARYTIHENVAWDHLQASPTLLAAMQQADAVCFGSLAQRSAESRKAIRQLVEATPAAALRVFDINLRQKFYSEELLDASFALANVVKLNDVELGIVSHIFKLGDTPETQMAALLDRWHLRAVACTRGAHGSLLFDGASWSDQAGLPAEVSDTIGAGDSFTAAMTIGLLRGWSLEKIGSTANEVAAFVCSCAGATPALPERLRAPFA